MGFHPYTFAVFGAMADKDIAGVLAHVKDKIDHWCLTDLPMPRAASAAALADKLHEAGISDNSATGAERSVRCFASPADAYADARKRAGENDRIVVFGSFLTVAGVLAVQGKA